MANIKSIVDKLQKHYPDASQVAVVERSGKLLHSRGKWDVKRDIKDVITNWNNGNAQFVTLDGIRYSILQMEPERFIATNRKNKGHLIGASTPDGNTLFIAHIKPKTKGWFHMAYPAVARAAAMITKKSESQFIETDVDLSNVSETNVVESSTGYNSSSVLVQQSSIDSSLKAEIDGFLQWINNPQGLAGYISYVLQQNDNYKISQLAQLYNEFYDIFYG
ncbi:MAG: hypothetical protein KGD58_12710 [Candidatus Lokiarchaeota archaeon]|nr:hypothetical protein [Candidatus Lokiarchaeota archaeon]